MSEKVPLHIYEKTQKSKKRIDRALMIIVGTVMLGLSLMVLYFIGSFCYAAWVAGGGGWLVGSFAFFGTLIYVGVKNNRNEKIMEVAQTYGVVDE